MVYSQCSGSSDSFSIREVGEEGKSANDDMCIDRDYVGIQGQYTKWMHKYAIVKYLIKKIS